MGCSNNSDSPEPEPQSATVSITASKSNAIEPDTNGAFTLQLSETVSSAVEVTLIISGTATNGTDYEKISSLATLPANTISLNIPVNVIDDTDEEGVETVTVTLSYTNNTKVKIGNPDRATVSISEEPEQAFVLKPEETRSYMVNANATEETVALFYNLKILSESKFIVGQQDAFNFFYNNNAGDSDIKKTTGNDPGLLGSDFMFITDDQNDETSDNWFYQQEQIIRDDAIEAYSKGMVNAFCWHIREPYEGKNFYTSEMTDFQKNNAFKSIIPGGENHEYYKQKLQKVAQVAKTLVGSDGKQVPIIFRLFHEFDGNWFWWGQDYCTPQEFIVVWRFTVEYLRDELGVNNMLFAFSPDNHFSTETQYLMRYPGDAYVDILGMDNYGDFNNKGQTGVDQANSKLQILTKLAKEKVKIAALTETGYFVTPGTNSPISDFYSVNLYNAITGNEVEIAYLMFWSNSENTYCTPVPGMPDTDNFIEFINTQAAILQNELPNIYTLPQ